MFKLFPWVLPLFPIDADAAYCLKKSAHLLRDLPLLRSLAVCRDIGTINPPNLVTYDKKYIEHIGNEPSVL